MSIANEICLEAFDSSPREPSRLKHVRLCLYLAGRRVELLLSIIEIGACAAGSASGAWTHTQKDNLQSNEIMMAIQP